jgi:hypothetical protein
VSASPSLRSSHSTTPSLPLVPLKLQGLAALIDNHRSSPTRSRMCHLTVDPPLWCASTPSSLPGATPGTHWCLPVAPCRRRSRHHAVSASSARAPRHRPRAVSSLDQATRPRTTRLFSQPRGADRHSTRAVAVGRFEAWYCAAVFKLF